MDKNKQKPNRIAELRHRFGISQEKLAEELNVTQASVSIYENTNNIPTDILMEIARYFEVPVDYLITRPNPAHRVPVENISVDEYSVLDFYRSLPTRYREAICGLIRVLQS